MMNIYEYLTVFAAFLIILAPTAMVAVAMGVTFGFVGMTFGFIKMTFGIIEMTFGFASFASGSVEMTFDAVGMSFGWEVMAWGWLEVPVGLHVAIVEGEFHAFQRDGSAPGGGCDGDGVVAVAQGVGRHGHGILVLALCQSAAAVVERRVVCAGGSHGLAVEAQAEQRLAAGAEEDDDFARTDSVHVVAHVDGHVATLSALERERQWRVGAQPVLPFAVREPVGLVATLEHLPATQFVEHTRVRRAAYLPSVLQLVVAAHIAVEEVVEEIDAVGALVQRSRAEAAHHTLRDGLVLGVGHHVGAGVEGRVERIAQLAAHPCYGLSRVYQRVGAHAHQIYQAFLEPLAQVYSLLQILCQRRRHPHGELYASWLLAACRLAVHPTPYLPHHIGHLSRVALAFAPLEVAEEAHEVQHIPVDVVAVAAELLADDAHLAVAHGAMGKVVGAGTVPSQRGVADAVFGMLEPPFCPHHGTVCFGVGEVEVVHAVDYHRRHAVAPCQLQRRPHKLASLGLDAEQIVIAGAHIVVERRVAAMVYVAAVVAVVAAVARGIAYEVAARADGVGGHLRARGKTRERVEVGERERCAVPVGVQQQLGAVVIVDYVGLG